MKATSVLLLAAAASAVEFRFTNKCDYTVKIRGSGGAYICDLQPGETKDKNCGKELKQGDIGIFKHTETNEANLLEYSLAGKVWYDISNIPPGPDRCNSYADCKRHTGKTGYNIPMALKPVNNDNGRNCRGLKVTSADSADAYLFPADDTKTHDCPMDTVFDVTYCPDNYAAQGAPKETPKGPSSGSCSVQNDVDYNGNDLFNFGVSGSRDDKVKQCCGKCSETGNCKGFTVYGNVCYIKSSTANPKPCSGCVAGAKAGSQGSCSGVEWNRDYWGNDIRGFDVSGDANTQAAKCCDACSSTGNCAGFTVNGNRCYLKHALTNPSWSKTAFSGRSTTKKAGCGGVEWNRDYWGNDIRGFDVDGDANAQAAKCCEACSNTGNCAGFTVNGKRCYLKHALTGGSWSQTAFSGRRN